MAEDDEERGFLDRTIALLTRLMTAMGLNGGRLLWRFRQRRTRVGELRAQREVLWRSTKARHKMCPSCRSLVDRAQNTCPDCGASLSGVSTPGVSRYMANLFPGISRATTLLMLVNGFWFVVMILAQIKSGKAMGGGLLGGFDLELIVRFGAGVSRPGLLANGEVAGGEWWRYVTPIFLHGGLLHFFFNSYMLIQLGPIIEDLYGTVRFWPIYLACGIAGTLASELPRFTITVGASGAIMGLIGVLLIYGYRGGGALRQTMKSYAGRLLVYMVILTLISWNPSSRFHIDHLNHAGGFVCGALLGWIVPTGAPRSERVSALWQILSLAGVLLVLWAFYEVAAAGALEPTH